MKTLKIIALIVAIAMFLPTATACREIGALKNLADGLQDAADDWQKYEEMTKKLTNYKITLTSVNSGGDPETYTELRCDEGYALLTRDSITYVEYGTGKFYILSVSDKTGMVYDHDSDDTYKGFGWITAGYLMMFQTARFMGAKKDGTDKILGRKTTCYTCVIEGNDARFWIDDEYGITVKFTSKGEDGESSMELTEFKTGGVKLSDIVKLGDYEITDLSSIIEGYNG